MKKVLFLAGTHWLLGLQISNWILIFSKKFAKWHCKQTIALAAKNFLRGTRGTGYEKVSVTSPHSDISFVKSKRKQHSVKMEIVFCPIKQWNAHLLIPFVSWQQIKLHNNYCLVCMVWTHCNFEENVFQIIYGWSLSTMSLWIEKRKLKTVALWSFLSYFRSHRTLKMSHIKCTIFIEDATKLTWVWKFLS